MKPLANSLSERTKLLESAEPERAFAPDPVSDVWKLAEGGNSDALESIRKSGLGLIHVATGNHKSLSDFAGGIVLFATTWEPYSAKTIGSLKRRVDDGKVGSFGLVLFEHSVEDVAAKKASAWYFNSAHVLASESSFLKALVREVPLSLFVGADGSLERVAVGKC